MTYNVFGGTLNLAQSVNQSQTFTVKCSSTFNYNTHAETKGGRRDRKPSFGRWGSWLITWYAVG